MKKACLRKTKKNQPKRIGKKRTGKYRKTVIICSARGDTLMNEELERFKRESEWISDKLKNKDGCKG